MSGDNCIGVLFDSYSNTQVVFHLGDNYANFGYLLAAGDAFTMNVLGASLSGHVTSIVPGCDSAGGGGRSRPTKPRSGRSRSSTPTPRRSRT